MKETEFKELFRLYSKDIFNYSHSLLKNKDDAKDAVQDVFIKFIETQSTFRGECSLKTWLLVITRNYCYKRLKKPLPVFDSIEENQQMTAEENICLKISVDDAIQSLTQPEYELVYLREYAGYSYNEISEIMNITLDLVKVKLFRVRRKLKKYLE